MSEEFTMRDLEAAARKWVQASEAVRRWRDEHIAFWWPDSGEPPPPEPKPVTRQALDEGKRLVEEERKAHEEFDRVNRGLLGLS